MKRGYLADYFKGVAAKNLTAVEVDPSTSNQHELNGVSDLRKILGTPSGRLVFPATFVYLSDNDPEPIVEEATLTWYDSRANKAHRSAEWRLYFPSTVVTSCASPGDLAVIGLKQDHTILFLVAESGSTIANQVAWLFGLSGIGEHQRFSVRRELETEQDRLSLTSTLILESLGIDVEVAEDTYLDQMLERFGGGFPATSVFSAYAREKVPEADPRESPDDALVAWMEREVILFRTLEKHLVADRLVQGFDGDVDGFLRFSLSVQNRRKSRAGQALEHHLGYIFDVFGVQCSRHPVTESGARPDFLFPGEREYHNPVTPNSLLTMLGAKSTCKDRWRQVLSEAERIWPKHLLTLEPAITEAQTSEMRDRRLQLIVPLPLQDTYTNTQREWLWSLISFLKFVGTRQEEFQTFAHQANRL